MDALAIPAAHVHGYSMGGAMTLRMLAQAPWRFITASVGGSGVPETDDALEARAEALDPPAPAPTGSDAAAFRLLRRRSAARRRLARDATDRRAARSASIEIDLPAVTVPVLAINGEYDRPRWRTHRMWRELADFQSVVLPGMNHMSAIGVGARVPNAYRAALIRFIRSHDRAASDAQG
jgi:pimeloyl-ACP methyl ester carboxylesterase